MATKHDHGAASRAVIAPLSRRSFVRESALGMFCALAGAGITAGELAGCASKPSNTATAEGLPTAVTLGTQQLPDDEEIAKAEDLLSELLGCPVNITEFDSGRDVNNALVSNSIDLGEIGSAPATLSVANRVPVRCVWIHQIIGEIEGLAARNDSGIETPQDLVGKIVATPFASTGHYCLMRCLEQNNISTSDLTILDMQPANIYAAWLRGDIDAAYVWQPVLGELLAEDGTLVTSSRDLAATGVVTSNIELARKEFAETYPQVVAAYIEVMDKAVQAYREDPERVFESVGASIGIGTEEAEVEMVGATWLSAEEQLDPAYLGDGETVGALADYLEDCADFLVTQQCLLEVPERAVFEEAIDPTYIKLYLEGKE